MASWASSASRLSTRTTRNEPVRCALRMLDAIAELNTATPGLDLAVRIGIMTGEAAVILAFP